MRGCFRDSYFQIIVNNCNDYLKIFDGKMVIHGIYEVEVKYLTVMIIKYLNYGIR